MSSYTTVPAMNKGVLMWIRRILETKSATHLREIEIEVRAVENIITVKQLEDLQKYIITKTTEPKPVITTNAARSVTELQQLHKDIATASASTPEPKTPINTKAVRTVSELKNVFRGSLKPSKIIKPELKICSQRTVSELAKKLNSLKSTSAVKSTQVLNVTGNVVERIARFQRMVDEKEQ